MATSEMIEREGHRAHAYQVLSACFCQPEKDLLDQTVFYNLSTSLGRISPPAAVLARDLAEAWCGYTQPELLVEYARLFLGPFKVPAPPYGSVYLEQAGLLMGDSTLAVAKIYQEQGLSLSEDTRDMPDHIAAELEFMYFLTSCARNALHDADRTRAVDYHHTGRLFLERFLGPFAVALSQKIEQETSNAFYLALAQCLRVFVLADLEHAERLAGDLSASS